MLASDVALLRCPSTTSPLNSALAAVSMRGMPAIGRTRRDVLCSSMGGVERREQHRVLVVDPEPMVRRVIARTIAATCTVEEAATGAEVLEALREGRRFDAIVCEVRLPDIDAATLLEEIGIIAPGQEDRMILLSALVDDTGEHPPATVGVPQRVLSKPFRLSEIRAAVDWTARERRGT